MERRRPPEPLRRGEGGGHQGCNCVTLCISRLSRGFERRGLLAHDKSGDECLDLVLLTVEAWWAGRVASI